MNASDIRRSLTRLISRAGLQDLLISRAGLQDLLLTGVLLLLFVSSLFLKFYYLESGSMAPAYPEGTVVVAAAVGEPETGDVCAYRHNDMVVVHRMIRKNGGKYYFQGDANNTEDPYPVSKDEIEARVLFGIPRLHLIFSVTNYSGGKT